MGKYHGFRVNDYCTFTHLLKRREYETDEKIKFPIFIK
jgi:hypothetical protein